MNDIQKQLRHIALKKRDEKGEEGVRVSEKSFVEWQAADEIERLRALLIELRDEIIPNWSKREAITAIDEALRND